MLAQVFLHVLNLLATLPLFIAVGQKLGFFMLGGSVVQEVGEKIGCKFQGSIDFCDPET